MGTSTTLSHIMRAHSVTCLVALVLIQSALSLPHEAVRGMKNKAQDLPYGGRIFVSNSQFVIDHSFNGLKAADMICQLDGEKLAGGADITWKAMITDTASCSDGVVPLPCRRATILPDMGDGQRDWILSPNAAYYRDDNKTLVGYTNDAGLFAFPLINQVNDKCSNPISGMDFSWITRDGLNCEDWTNGTNDDSNRMSLGWTCSLGSDILDGGIVPCGWGTLYCVGPAQSRTTDPKCGKYGECNYQFCAVPTNDSIECVCRCGCMWQNSSSVRQEPHETVGAVIVPENWKPSADATPMELAVYEQLTEPKLQPKAVKSQDAPFCTCNSPGGFPWCDNNYPLPVNSSLMKLASPASPLTSADRITVFGDSITWLGGYYHLIQEVLNASGINPIFVNRGINGGMVKDVRDGASKFGQNYTDFVTALKEDKPTYITIMIGINDVWFSTDPNASNVTTFSDILTGLVNTAHEMGVRVGLASVSIIGELPDGTNSYDAPLHIFANATQTVASVAGAGFGDVHSEYLDYEKKYNVYPAGGGMSANVLTIDGVHPCHGYFDVCPSTTHANMILANQISEAILQASLIPI
eukprot:c5230_g1_i1.p1 GENE.c5230_g1_i1~~c5230_g1_i1.p1  ORF type:complete len:582 (+),score=138.34 c5230_g1_i1:1-1746(+)